MAHSVVKDLTDDERTMSVTRSGSVRRNLDPLLSNSIARKPLIGIKTCLVFREGVKSDNPKEMFYFIKPKNMLAVPPYVSAKHNMTPVERNRIVQLIGKNTGMTMQAKIFCRIEEGINEDYACHNYDAIVKLFAMLVQIRGNARQAYEDVVNRFPEAMRANYSYPDIGVDGRVLEEVDLAAEESQSLLAHTSTAPPGQRIESQSLFELQEVDTQNPSTPNKQASQTFPISAAAKKVYSPLQTAVGDTPAKGLLEKRSSVKRATAAPSPAEVHKAKSQKTGTPAKPRQSAKGVTPEKNATEESRPTTPEQSTSGKQRKSKGKGVGKNSAAARTSLRSKRGEQNKNTDSSEDSDDGSQPSVKLPKKKASRKKRSRSQASHDSDGQHLEDLVTQGKKKKLGVINSDSDFEEEPLTPKDNGKEKPGKGKSTFEKKPCSVLCNCWNLSEAKLLEAVGPEVSIEERLHRILIHQHKVATSLRTKVTALKGKVDAIDHTNKQQTAIMERTEDYSKTSARNMGFKLKRAKDIEEYELPVKTFTRLKMLVDNHPDLMKRCLTYADHRKGGENFVQSLLKFLMDPALLYRCWPSDSKGKNKPKSGKLMTFGTEYFRLPPKLQEMMLNYSAEHFDQGNVTDTRKKLRSYLEYSRKTRRYQMRNYLVARINKSPHRLYYALLWDNEKKLGVFDKPAPIWDGNTTEQMTAYLDRFMPDWLHEVDMTPGLQKWYRTIPASFGEPDPDSKAERKIEAPKAEVEGYWAFDNNNQQ